MSQVQVVKDAHNIIDVIGSYLQLQHAGSNYRGLCPFHSEKSPSFFVSETMQRYKCFGCGKTGDIFTFLQDYEGLTFYESLESLAQKAGITLEASIKPSQEDTQKKELLVLLDQARAYYHYLLTEHEVGASAREYLKKRGITNESIQQFQLGYALPTWDGLTTYLTEKKNFPADLLLHSGMAVKGKHGLYDRFRHRIMFPLKNARGQVVGFSGRVFAADSPKEEPKYINTPETQLYHKGRMLYGLYENGLAVRKEKRIILVEGEFDMISSVQAHVSAVAAIKGSALTTDHVQLLARSVDQIILALDADAAGLAATEKAIGVVAQAQVSREQPLSLLVIRVPSGKDPDELSQTEPKLWRETAKHPITPYEFLLDVACEKFDSTTLMGKQQIMQQVTPIFAQIQHAVQFEYFTKVLAERLDVSVSSVQKDIKAFARRSEQKAPEKMLSKKPAEQKKLSKRERLENYLLFLVFHSASADQRKRLTELASLPLQNEGLSAALAALLLHDIELTAAIKKIDIDQQELVFELSTHPEMEETISKLNITQEWNIRMTELQKEVRSSRAKEIGKRLEELDALTTRTTEEDAEYTHLLQELTVVRVSSPSS